MSDSELNKSQAKESEMLCDEQRQKLNPTRELLDIPDIQPTLRTHEAERAQIGYTPDFKKLVQENPHLIQTFLDIENEIKSESPYLGKIFQRDNVCVEVLNYTKWYSFYRVIIDGESYFVKADKASEGHRAYHEIVDSEKAKERLGENPVPGVRVVDYQLGFTKGPKRYFVAKWVDGERVDRLFREINLLEDTRGRYMDQWLMSPDRTERLSEIEEKLKKYEGKKEILQKRIDDVRNLFPTYYDVNPNNFIYNENNDELVWIDINDWQRDPIVLQTGNLH